MASLLEPDPALAEHPYFIVVGAIEQRKNLPLLLNVWTELRRRRGKQTPRLVIAGSPGRGGRPILRQLQSFGAADDVMVASGLPSPALRRLVVNARAVLMPSLAEGFGLPIIEALAVVVRTIRKINEEADDALEVLKKPGRS